MNYKKVIVFIIALPFAYYTIATFIGLIICACSISFDPLFLLWIFWIKPEANGGEGLLIFARVLLLWLSIGMAAGATYNSE